MLHRKYERTTKGATIDTPHLQPGERFHMYFAFDNVTSIRGLTSILIIVCSKTIIIWIFTTVSKLSPVRIIHFILSTLNNEQHPCENARVDNNGALANSTYVTNLLVDELIIKIETTGGYAS